MPPKSLPDVKRSWIIWFPTSVPSLPPHLSHQSANQALFHMSRFWNIWESSVPSKSWGLWNSVSTTVHWEMFSEVFDPSTITYFSVSPYSPDLNPNDFGGISKHLVHPKINTHQHSNPYATDFQWELWRCVDSGTWLEYISNFPSGLHWREQYPCKSSDFRRKTTESNFSYHSSH